MKNRRTFLGQATAATVGGVVGMTVPFGRHWPAGLMPVAHAAPAIEGKHPGLVILNDRPLNAEVPAHLLDDAVTPADRMFVRNNGIPPKEVDAAAWRLTIDGEAAARSMTFSIAELKKQFKTVRYQLVLECGGNGRAEFRPNARGNQWTTGAVSCAEWEGVRLKDVLTHVGLKKDAVYVGYYGADSHLSGDVKKVVISRGAPMAKAMQPETLIAFGMNGKPIPPLHGAPLRLVAGGWPASVSGKWLKRLTVRNVVHDGPKMGGKAYRVPCAPVKPGAVVDDQDMCIIESMPVKSLLTWPASATSHPAKKAVAVRGHAWAGEQAVSRVDISIDFGQTWTKAKLEKPKNRLAWQRFSGSVVLPQKGYYEVWARATDASGRAQPMLVPGWNPKGYLNNACHRIALQAV